MALPDHFRAALIELDVPLVRKIWAHVAAHLPQPRSDAEALTMAHRARSEAKSIPFRHRAYSHRWLLDNGYPSGLPDKLRPRAERMYPRIVEAVGIAVRVPEHRAELGKRIQTAMSDAVLEAYADKRTDSDFVRARMMEARQRQLRRE